MTQEAQDLVAAATEAHNKALTDVRLVGFELLTLVWNPETGAYQIRGAGNATVLVGLLTRAAMAMNAVVANYTAEGKPLETKPPETPPTGGVLQ